MTGRRRGIGLRPILFALICSSILLLPGRAAADTSGPGASADSTTATTTQPAVPAQRPAERLTHAQRFERSPGVLGTSIRTMRKGMIKDYSSEDVGYLALDLTDLHLNPVSNGEGLKVNLADKLQFASRNDVLPKEAKPLLDAIALLLVQNPSYLIQIIVHTDDRGDAGYNMRLSQRRAEAVKTYLTERGIEAVRLIAIGRGEAEPLTPFSGRRATRAERAKNRRVELLIEPMELPAPPASPVEDGTEQTRQAATHQER